MGIWDDAKCGVFFVCLITPTSILCQQAEFEACINRINIFGKMEELLWGISMAIFG